MIKPPNKAKEQEPKQKTPFLNPQAEMMSRSAQVNRTSK